MRSKERVYARACVRAYTHPSDNVGTMDLLGKQTARCTGAVTLGCKRILALNLLRAEHDFGLVDVETDGFGPILTPY